jgi:hypothetical protein
MPETLKTLNGTGMPFAAIEEMNFGAVVPGCEPALRRGCLPAPFHRTRHRTEPS